MKKRTVKVKAKGAATITRRDHWKCPGCEVTYVLDDSLFSNQRGATLCKDCLHENELLCRLGRIRETTSEA